jgi:hypothetical protein
MELPSSFCANNIGSFCMLYKSIKGSAAPDVFHVAHGVHVLAEIVISANVVLT